MDIHLNLIWTNDWHNVVSFYRIWTFSVPFKDRVTVHMSAFLGTNENNWTAGYKVIINKVAFK